MAGVIKIDESIPGTHGGIYRDGPYEVEIVSVRSSSDYCSKSNRVATTNTSSKAPGLAPKPLVVALPKEEGDYPVVQFHHGFTLQNAFYTQLISHIASHGFIVVASQMCTVSSSDAMLEIKEDACINSDLDAHRFDPVAPIAFLPSPPQLLQGGVGGSQPLRQSRLLPCPRSRHQRLEIFRHHRPRPSGRHRCRSPNQPSHPTILTRLLEIRRAHAPDRHRVRSPETELPIPALCARGSEPQSLLLRQRRA